MLLQGKEVKAITISTRPTRNINNKYKGKRGGLSMEKYYGERNGKKFPVREVIFEVCDGMKTMVKVADIDLWDAIEYACYHENHARHSEAVDLDIEIYFYCDYGFIASDPTDKEIVEYLIKHGC